MDMDKDRLSRVLAGKWTLRCFEPGIGVLDSLQGHGKFSVLPGLLLAKETYLTVSSCGFWLLCRREWRVLLMI